MLIRDRANFQALAIHAHASKLIMVSHLTADISQLVCLALHCYELFSYVSPSHHLTEYAKYER